MSSEKLKDQHATPPEKFLGWTIDQLTKLPKSETKGRENLEIARQWLSEGNSVLAYFAPHRVVVDPMFITLSLKENLIDSLPQEQPIDFGWVASAKFTVKNIKPLRSMGVASPASRGWVIRNEYDWFEVVQPYIYRGWNPQDKLKASQLNTSSLLGSVRFLRQGSSVLAASIEGTRNKKTFGLLRAEDGLEILLRQKNVLGIPLILDIDYFGKSKIPKSSAITFAQPILHQDALEIAQCYQWQPELVANPKWGNPEFTASDAMLLHLANQGLPQIKEDHDPRGLYVPENLVFTEPYIPTQIS